MRVSTLFISFAANAHIIRKFSPWFGMLHRLVCVTPDSFQPWQTTHAMTMGLSFPNFCKYLLLLVDF